MFAVSVGSAAELLAAREESVSQFGVLGPQRRMWITVVAGNYYKDQWHANQCLD